MLPENRRHTHSYRELGEVQTKAVIGVPIRTGNSRGKVAFLAVLCRIIEMYLELFVPDVSEHCDWFIALQYFSIDSLFYLNVWKPTKIYSPLFTYSATYIQAGNLHQPIDKSRYISLAPLPLNYLNVALNNSNNTTLDNKHKK